LLKKKLFGPSVKNDSKIMLFEKENICVPKGFECSIQLQILMSGFWYNQLAQPRADKIVCDGGTLLGSNVFFRVHSPQAADRNPHLCPISRIFFRPAQD
jgi:hypothetical protein